MASVFTPHGADRLLAGCCGLLLAATLVSPSTTLAQAVGGAEKARPVAGDPGISSMVVMDMPAFRVLRLTDSPPARWGPSGRRCRRRARR